MGISANQARFLSLTSRQIDLEKRIQDICQRRMRLSTQLENIATAYNNAISNRKMFTSAQTNGGIQALSIVNLEALGYKVLGLNTDKVAQRPTIDPTGKTVINSQDQFMQIVQQMNASGTGLNGNYVLNCDLDLSKLGTLSTSLIKGAFTGTFDGNGHKIDGLSINTTATENGVGMFSKIETGATVKNVDLENATINAANSTSVGALAGMVNTGSTVNNCYVSGSVSAVGNAGGLTGNNQGTITNSTADVDVTVNDPSAEARAGGFVGSNNGGGVIQNCNSLGNVTVLNGTYNAGGFAATDESPSSLIEGCTSSGTVTVAGGTVNIGGFLGGVNEASVINCYTTSTVNAPYSANQGGFVGCMMNSGTVRNSYASNEISNPSATGFAAGMSGGATSGATNFYVNNSSYAAGGEVNGATNPLPTATWDSSVWDKSTNLPTLKNCGFTAYADSLEEGLRNGTYSLAKPADEFSQETVSIGGNKYEKVDWRTAPELYDELYGADDEDAENKYDKATAEINAQDKKLQLEDASIEVEYKEVSSEKEAVKKILDTNAQSSFKYFS